MNRRDFIKRSMWAVGVLGLFSPPSVLGQERKPPVSPLSGYRWDKTIFCQFSDPALQREIEKIAKTLDCRVFYGEPDSFDIIGVPYFISVVDRRLVGKQAWETYLEYCRQSGDQTPCLVIDSQGRWDLPSQRNFIYINLSSKKINDHIKNLIVAAKAGYPSRYYG